MNKLKKEKGITLIALIITIVILLILAVVTIGAVKDSNIIGYAQNAAGSFNQAKANEVDALTKYDEEIEKYAPGEKKDYIGNLRLNTKYMVAGKEKLEGYLIFYPNEKVDFGGEEKNYSIAGNIVNIDGIKFNIIKEEKNDILIMDGENLLFSTSKEGLKHFKGEKYVCGDKYVVLNETDYKYSTGSGGGEKHAPPVFYNGTIYPVEIDMNRDGNYAMATSTDDCDTIVIDGETYTKSIE